MKYNIRSTNGGRDGTSNSKIPRSSTRKLLYYNNALDGSSYSFAGLSRFTGLSEFAYLLPYTYNSWPPPIFPKPISRESDAATALRIISTRQASARRPQTRASVDRSSPSKRSRSSGLTVSFSAFAIVPISHLKLTITIVSDFFPPFLVLPTIR